MTSAGSKPRSSTLRRAGRVRLVAGLTSVPVPLMQPESVQAERVVTALIRSATNPSSEMDCRPPMAQLRRGPRAG